MVDRPPLPACHDDRLGPVVVVQLGSVVVGELLLPHEVLVEVHVDRVPVHVRRVAGVPEAGRLVDEAGGHVGAIVLPVRPEVVRHRVASVVLHVPIEDPDAVETARLDPIVELVEIGGVVCVGVGLPILAGPLVAHKSLL